MQSNHRRLMMGIAASLTMLTLAGCGNAASPANSTTGSQNATSSTGGAGTGPVTIMETGSSLLYPLFNGQWIVAYQKVTPSVRISAAATGSGAGIAHAIDGTAQIGASDAYMPDAQKTLHPTMLNIPLAISAQQIMYNLPGMKSTAHVHLNGQVLAGIYSGKIRYWNDKAITALNPGISLPHHQFIPVHRSDGSGDTFLFTQYLSDTSSAWQSTSGYGTEISWPAIAGEVGAKGNSDVVQALASNPYSIGYVGISWLDKAAGQGLGYAALQNKAGQFVVPQTSTIQSAANAMVGKVGADERVSLINAPGANSYPIINFEYAVVNTQQTSSMGSALKKFLTWAIDPKQGNSGQFLNPVHFLPLPSAIQPLSKAQIAKISS